jgi:hypothetical protein
MLAYAGREFGTTVLEVPGAYFSTGNRQREETGWNGNGRQKIGFTRTAFWIVGLYGRDDAWKGEH